MTQKNTYANKIEYKKARKEVSDKLVSLWQNHRNSLNQTRISRDLDISLSRISLYFSGVKGDLDTMMRVYEYCIGQIEEEKETSTATVVETN